MKHILFFTCAALFFGLQMSCAVAQPQTESTVPVGNNTEDARQLRIYREALMQGSSEDIRIDAAVGLLLRKDTQSRQVLVSALTSEDNPAAQTGVCKALIKSRGIRQSMGAVDVFLEPLLGLLQRPSTDQAELAAEAMLVFDYDAVEKPLNQLVHDAALEKGQRIHALYAIHLRPEPSALKLLIGLLDDPDADIAQAAEKALQDSFGIPVGTSRSEWAAILQELQKKQPSEIRRERLLQQEIKIRQMQAESLRWQKLYLASLDKQYDLLDETAAAKMILEMMESDLTPIRLWALDKIARTPVMVNDRIYEKLASFLWDDSRQVRLQTARTLKNMSAKNPAARLLERFNTEKDPEVALAIFEALGEACSFALSPGSKIDLPREIKDNTLQIASDYLGGSDPQEVVKSAEVFRKLLELSNIDIESSVMQGYLQELQQRYVLSVTESAALQADLLGILSHLCGQGGAKALASELYEPLFIEALKVQDNPTLRVAAARGLANVDKVKALELFKYYQLHQAESPAIRYIVIEVAAQAGDATDVEWLRGLLSSNGQSESAWSAIKGICQRQKFEYLIELLPSLKPEAGFKDEYVRELLNMAEQKAAGGQNPQQVSQIQQMTLSWMVERKLWEQGASYLDTVVKANPDLIVSENVQLCALKIYLYSSQTKKLTLYLQNRLSQMDAAAELEWVAAMKAFFADSKAAGELKQSVLAAMKSITVADRPVWNSFVQETDLFLNPPPQEAVPIIPAEGSSELGPAAPVVQAETAP